MPPTLSFAAPPPPVAAAAPPPARMLVFASEHRLNPSRRRMPAGRAIIQMRNIGEDPHDLVVRRADGRVVARMAEVRPGRTGEVRTRLPAGRYRLVCTVTGHEALGMVAAFVVTRRARG